MQSENTEKSVSGVKGKLLHLTLGQKIGLAFSVIMAIMAIAMLITHLYVNNIQKISANTIEHRLPLTFMTLEAQNNLKEMTNTISLYLLTDNPQLKKRYEEKEERMDFFFDAIENYFEHDETDFEIIVVIDKAKNTYYKQYRKAIRELLEIHDDFYRRFPGLAYATDRLNPLALEFSSLVTEMIDEIEGKPAESELFSLLNKVRHYWSQMGNYTRLYFTTRSEDTYTNAMNFRGILNEYMYQLENSKKEIIPGARERLLQINREWGDVMQRVVEIYNSDKWRGDTYYLKNNLEPVLAELNTLFHSLAIHQISISNRYGDDLIAQVTNAKIFNMAFLLSGSVIGILIAAMLTKNISNRIRVLVGAAQRFADGDLDTKVEQSGKDDISELSSSFNDMAHKLKQTLKENEAMTANVQEKARYLESQKLALDEHAIVSITDCDGVIRYANEKFVEISGFSKEELIGKPHSLVSSGFHTQSFWQKLWNTINRGEVWHGVVKNRSKQGEYYWVDTTIVPFLNDVGMPYQFVSIRTDITERKRLQDKQQQRQARMAAQQDALMELAKSSSLINGELEQSIKDIIAVVSRCMSVSRVSAWGIEDEGEDYCPSYLYDGDEGSYTELKAYNKDKYPAYFQLISTTRFVKVDDVETDTRIPEFYESYLAPNKIASFLDVSIIHDGKIIGVLRCEEVVYPRHWHFDEQHFLISIADLVSIAMSQASNKKAEKKISEFAMRLEQSNKELYQALVASQQAEKMKSEFLATMSHELRTPMNGIMGMLSLLQEITETGEQKEYIQAAYSSATLLLELLNDVLDFSKIDSDRIELEHIEFNVSHIINNVRELMSVKAMEKGIDLVYTSDNRVPELLIGDPTRLRQVITNLVSNAIKFTDQGGVTISLAYLHGTSEHTTIRVSVKDTGIGIPVGQQAAIFDAFKQADGSTTRKYGGTGLGLAICKRLIEIMGGTIDVKSTEGEGSEFYFDITMQNSISSVLEFNRVMALPCNIFVLDCNSSGSLVIGDHKECGVNDVYYCTSLEELDEHLKSHAVSSVRRNYIFVHCDDFNENISSLPRHLSRDDLINTGDRIVLFAKNAVEQEEVCRDAGFDGCLDKKLDMFVLCGIIKLFKSGAVLSSFVTSSSLENLDILQAHNIVFMTDNKEEYAFVGSHADGVGWTTLFIDSPDGMPDSYPVDVSLLVIDSSVIDDGSDLIQALSLFRKKAANTPILLLANSMDQLKEVINSGLANTDVICKPVASMDLKNIMLKWIMRDIILHGNEGASDADDHADYGFLEHQDADKIDDLKMLMGDDFNGFIRHISADIKLNIDELYKAIDASNYSEIMRLLTNIKNTALTIGLGNLTSYCDMLINQLQTQNCQIISDYVSNIGDAINNTLAKVS